MLWKGIKMDIIKEFAPITIKIETKEELRVFKKLARQALSYNRFVRFCPRMELEDYEELAKKISDL